MVIEHALLKVILENVEGHISDEIIVEIALEIFIVMSLNGKLIQGFNHILSFFVGRNVLIVLCAFTY